MILDQPSTKLTMAGRTTLIGVVVIIFCLMILAGLLLPSLSRGGARAPRIKCISNQKQIGLAYRIFSNDHDDKYPFNVEGQRLYDSDPGRHGQGGNPLLYRDAGSEAWMHLQSLSNELSSAKVLMCPADRNRKNNEAIDLGQGQKSFSHASKRNQALSYFIGLEADESKPQSILGGDRNIAGQSATGPIVDESLPAMPGGVHLLGPNDSRGARRRWSNNPNNAIHDLQGNITLADGSVQQVSGQKLEDQLDLSRESYGTNNWLFAFPNDYPSTAQSN